MSQVDSLQQKLSVVDCVLWDLDGTLTDSIVDICASMNVVLSQYGLGVWALMMRD